MHDTNFLAFVIPAKAGIQNENLGLRLRGADESLSPSYVRLSKMLMTR